MHSVFAPTQAGYTSELHKQLYLQPKQAISSRAPKHALRAPNSPGAVRSASPHLKDRAAAPPPGPRTSVPGRRGSPGRLLTGMAVLVGAWARVHADREVAAAAGAGVRGQEGAAAGLHAQGEQQGGAARGSWAAGRTWANAGAHSAMRRSWRGGAT